MKMSLRSEVSDSHWTDVQTRHLPSVRRMEQVLGAASIRRVGRLRFPVAVFVADETSEGRILAKLGRDGWFRVFFGLGRRI